MEELKVNITSDNKEIIIRTGEAEEISKPIAEKFSGTINAPSDYIAIRKPDPQTAIVLFSKKDMSISYRSNPSSEFGVAITGFVQINPDLKAFNINADVQKTPKQLADFIKMNRIYFKDRDSQAIVVTKLNDLTLTVNKEVAAKQDNRGNASASIDRKVTSNIPVSFVLSMPIIVGGAAKDFTVEVGVDVRDAGISVWLESVELAELMKGTADALIDEELKHFKDAGLVVIEY